MLASFESSLRKFKVGVGRCRNNDNIDFRVSDEGLDIGIVFESWEVLRGRASILRCPLDNRVEYQLGSGGDEGDMEDFSGQAAYILVCLSSFQMHMVRHKCIELL